MFANVGVDLPEGISYPSLFDVRTVNRNVESVGWRYPRVEDIQGLPRWVTI